MFFNRFPNLGRLACTADQIWWDAEMLRSRMSDRLAQLDGKISANSIVLLGHGGTPEFVADLLAVWSCGAAAACINPALTGNEIDTLKRFVKPAAAILHADQDAQIFQANRQSTEAVTLDSPALLLFTSGTTGNPKGVTHSFRSLSARISLNQAYMGSAALQKTLCPLPTHFGHGLIGNVLTPLFAGGDVLLLSDRSPVSLSRLGALIDENAISFLSSVPTFWKMVQKLSLPPKNKTLKRVHVGSAPLSIDLWDAITKWAGTAEVFNMYGITETANWIGGTSLQEGRLLDGRIGSLWGGNAMIKQDDGNIQNTGTGEILIQCPSLMSGYYNQPDLTREVLKDGWFYTGDIGTIEEDGEIRLTGRSKSEINRAGMKILPEEIDLLLERHTEVVEVCVFGLPDAISGEKVAVACVLKDDSTITRNELIDWMKNLIRPEAIPETWFFIDEIPKTDRGKINRDNVREVCLKGIQ